MNIVYKHIRKKTNNEVFYFDILVKCNKSLLNRYFKGVNLHDLYEKNCVKQFPLNDSKFYCHSNPNSGYRLKYKCLECWIKVLENPDKYMTHQKKFPVFLSEKQTPKFLK